MADFAEILENIVTSGIRIVNRTANTVTQETRYKLGELDSMSRRREAITELGQKVYDLFQAGVDMPEEALPLLNELRALDEGLTAMRSEHAVQKAAQAEERQAEKATRKEERAAAKAARAAQIAAAKEAAARMQAEVAEAATEIAEEVEEAAEEVAPVLEVPAEEIAEVAQDEEVPVIEVPDEEEEPKTL